MWLYLGDFMDSSDVRFFWWFSVGVCLQAEAYWASVSCDVDGMLGGFAHLHSPDIFDSKKFISHLKAKVCFYSSSKK